MSCLSRLFGLLLIVLIFIVTPVAFWAFNVDRVAMNPQTYKTALRSQNFYDTLLPALVDATAANDGGDPQIRTAAAALVKNVSPDDWALLSEKLMPADWLQAQIVTNIDQFFAWINGTRSLPDVKFDLALLKERLTSSDAAAVAEVIAPKLPACTDAQEAIFAKAIAGTPGGPDLPLCYPKAPEARVASAHTLTALFHALGTNLPGAWTLADHIRGDANMDQFAMNRFRAFLWLDSRLIVLLFLIPVALFALIIMVTIRSTKQLFRWLGWGLILSGLLTLVPVPFLTAPALGLAPGVQESFGTSGRLIGSLTAGMVSSVMSGLTLAVLTQVIVVIVIGFVAVFVSVLLPAPPPNEVSWHDVARERMAQHREMVSQIAMGSTPRPFPSTVASPQTPAPQYTPPNLARPTAPAPDPLADLFPQNAPNLTSDTLRDIVVPTDDNT